MGNRSLSLADFAWDDKKSRMIYTAHSFRFGELLNKPEEEPMPSDIRLYTLEELQEILSRRGMLIEYAYGDYDTSVSATEDTFTLLVQSKKIRP